MMKGRSSLCDSKHSHGNLKVTVDNISQLSTAPSTAAVGHIELRGVTFSYPARPEAPVLDGLSLYAMPGETVAIVGRSGGGKSTVLQLVSSSSLFILNVACSIFGANSALQHQRDTAC